MGLDIALLEKSFQAVAPKGEQLAVRFYERLFQKYPAVRPLFAKANIKRQQKKLLSALVLVIGNLRKPDKLKPVLLDLGAKHVGYGAEPAHYVAVGENLLAVLEEFAGPSWTNEVRQAWVEAYDLIKQIMLEGAEQAPSQKYPRQQSATSLMNLAHTRSLQKGVNAMGGISEKINNWSLATKLSILFCLFGAVPIVALGYMSWQTGEDMKAKVGKQFESAAVAVADKIDRNLFERYGDVQAFALNDAVQRTSQWYDSSELSVIAPIMDKYISTYGIYYLTLLVDTKGQLISVNYHDATGQPINYKFLFKKDFSKTRWFQALEKKEFTTSTPFSAEGNRGSTGTYIEDVHFDEDVKQAYPGDPGLTMGFSAPVYGPNGEVVAYWSNRAKFSLVEEIVSDSYREIKANGYPGAEITLLDSVGKVIVDYDPMVHGKEAPNHNFEKVIFKLNLAEKGVAAAQASIAGKTGYANAMHARKKIVQASGYTHLKGALGYPGMNWAVLVRIPEEEAAVDAQALMQKVMMVAIGCLALILPLGLWVGRKGATQIKVIQEAAQKMASGDFDSRATISSGDEIGQLGESFNHMAEEIQAKNIDMARVNSMMENAPVNVMFVDLDLVLRYMNPASKKTLKGLEHLLPVKVDDMIGTCIDVFHKNPAHQRKILGDPKNFPYQTNIELGDETLDLLVSGIFDNDGNYIGAMATWKIITAKLEQQRQMKEAAEREREQAQRLQEGVAEIAEIGTSLAGASEELTSVSSTMGSTAEETSSQANVVAAAAEEVSKNVQSVSTGSEEMTASIQEIAKNTTDAARVAAQAVTVAESTNATVGKLGQSSAEIGSIIKVITTIAEQTNLLALNATIEAARAGDAGKGFAVVANEVKELAKETTKATENISRMIETIQEDTKGSVDAIEEISTIIKQVNDYMNTIASAVEEQTVTTNEMARNVTEASKGSTEIAGNIVSVADAAQGTTEGATQTQQASSELSRMAQDLQRVVATLT